MEDPIIAESSIDDVVEGVKNATGREAATTEGLALAYVSLFLMAVVPIFWGSFRSVTFHRRSKEKGEKVEKMTTKDVYMFPIIASGTLFSIYIIVKYLSAEHLNLVIASYFFILGTLALTSMLRPVVEYIPGSTMLLTKEQFHMKFTRGSEALFDMKFDELHIVSLIGSALFGVWYMWKKHWIANNIFGLAFSLNGVEMISLGSVKNGCVLLGLLFFYDVFWVFGTEVMVMVAKNLDAPIKVIFPMDFLEKGIFGTNFAMLGLGDIVLPGVFIALLLRYDTSLGTNSKKYFYAGFVAYIIGLGATIGVLTIFNAAQPALLYLVPTCVGIPLLLSLVCGMVFILLTKTAAAQREFASIMAYDEEDKDEEKKVSEDDGKKEQ